MPLIIYFLMGTSRQLSVGPEGVSSLLAGSAVIMGYPEFEEEMTMFEYTIPRAACLSALVGLFMLLLGLLRTGFVENLISRPILHGFVSASGAIILVGQLDIFLGFSVPEQEWEKLIGVYENIELTNYYSLGIGLVCVATILVIDFTKAKLGHIIPPLKYLPTPAVIVGVSILVVWLTGWSNTKGVLVLGVVEGGFPVPVVPTIWNLKMSQSLVISAVLISLVGFVESNAIAKSYALEHCYEVSSNREMVALGVVNIAGVGEQDTQKDLKD